MALMEAAVTNPKYKPGTDPAKGEIIVTSCDASKMALREGEGAPAVRGHDDQPLLRLPGVRRHRGALRRPAACNAFIPVTDFFIDVSNIAQYEAFGF